MPDDFRRTPSGLYVPKTMMADRIGMGCPRCDDHYLEDPMGGEASAAASKFMKKHQNCGELDTLEERQGQKYCTGKFNPKLS